MTGRVASELFLSRLSFYTTAGRLEKLFAPFGFIEEVRLIKDRKTQRPTGFGFIKFGSELDARNAVKSMNGRIVDGRLIFVEFAKTPKSETSS